ncbi:MAG TPA: hypothetical protein VFT64_06665 [Rickettsiales bacterium]|nr:hypothetical protein [Rickettsiales bacterium]
MQNTIPIPLKPRERMELDIDSVFFQYSQAKLWLTNQRLIFQERTRSGKGRITDITFVEITQMRIGANRITIRYDGDKKATFSVQEERSGAFSTHPEATLELFEWLETMLPNAETGEDRLTRKGHWFTAAMIGLVIAFIILKLMGTFEHALHPQITQPEQSVNKNTPTSAPGTPCPPDSEKPAGCEKR